MKKRTVLSIGLVAAAAAIVVTALTGARSSCIPVAEGCVEHADCAPGQYCDEGACEVLGWCETAADCYGQPIIVPLCLGYFTCAANACAWHCGPQPLTCDPAVPRACGDELVCVAASLDAPGVCQPFEHGVTVGAGYACGGSIGVGCAEGLFCAGLPYGRTGGTGVCTDMTCSDWYREYQALTTTLRHCQTAADCVAVPGTSCGCTRNLVLNRSEDLTPFWRLVEQMNADGCGLATTCDCPPADGYVCREGLCGWNYL
jgi:hypothetical protein